MSKEISHSLSAGTILGDKWIILEFIAKGGMGEIYRAHQMNLKRDVAIKIISTEWLNDIREDQEEIGNALQRFRQEVQTMVQIHHPNVIQIYDYESAQVAMGDEMKTIEYMVLEYIPDRTIRDTMPEEGFYPDEEGATGWIKKYFLPVLDGVQVIHKSGIFHRDIKPENILMEEDTPKIADFGLAKSYRLASMTSSMEIKGTPAYMANEQFVDFKRSDQRSDIYSLGKILFEAIDGKITLNAIPFKMVRLKRTETAFFQKLDNIIQQATSETVKERFQSIEEFKKALLDVLKPLRPLVSYSKPKQQWLPKGSNRKTWIAAFVSAILALMFSFFAYYYPRGSKPVLPSKETVIAAKRGLPLVTVGPVPASLSPKVEAPDGSTLRLIPGGTLRLPSGFNNGTKEETVTIKPFYMDQTQITNDQYVRFLNQVLSMVHVEKGVVKSGDNIWLYLGDVMEGYEPIVFSGGRFRLKYSGHSACPVLRVTAYGAAAYLHFYHRRLPTKAEWLFAALEGKNPAAFSREVSPLPESFFEPIKLPLPVILFKQNAFGIRGINENLGEWVLDSIGWHKFSKEKDRKYAIMSGFEKEETLIHQLPMPVIRQPWEAFEEIGFRGVKDIT